METKTVLKSQKSGVFHKPYHIIDEQGNHIATLFHNDNLEEYLNLFLLSPVLKKTLWKILDEVSNEEQKSTISIELLNEITELLIKFKS